MHYDSNAVVAVDTTESTKTVVSRSQRKYPSGCGPGDFKCRNRKCIRYYQKCDGRADCEGGEDEDNCRKYSLTELCPLGEFTCNSRLCIELERRCDEVIDCPDASDEVGCPCLGSQFQCDDGSCIEQSQKCNRVTDCSDGSDERDCDKDEYNCADDFECGDVCLARIFVCDSTVDCVNGADEKDCPCNPSDFRCSNGTCIPASLKCDGRNDCSGGEDESLPECLGRPLDCLDGEFTCDSGQCIHRQFVCDGIADCQDKTDEDPFRCRESACMEDDFICHDTRKCIRSGLRCDGTRNCNDGSDELNCQSQCKYTEYECATGHCIQASQRCDGRSDCQDGSDERNCYDGQCDSQSQFQCDSGQCVSKSAKCNRVEDCDDGSDESNCIPNEIQLVTSPASQEIEESKEAVFQCRDEGPSRYRVRWLRGDGQPLPEGSRTLNNGARLEIPNVQLRATGTYYCEAVGAPRSAPGSKTTVYLKVLPFVKIPDRDPIPGVPVCQYDEATCYNRQCIPKTSVCDGKADCSDGSDESRCASQHCEANMFMCENRECIIKTWRCDNQKDCLDGSDEIGCEVSKNGTCYTTEFACRSGDQCIPRGMLCDKQRDCADNSDEIGCKDPEIIVPPRAVVQLCPGEELVLHCEASGFPVPIINWRLNWGHVPKKCRMESINGRGVLTCPDIQLEDSGAYSCEAINGRSKFAIPDANVIMRRNCGPVPEPCVPGTFNDLARTPDECIECFCFGRSTECKSANLYSFKLPAPTGTFPLVQVKFEPTTEISPGVYPVQNYLTAIDNGFVIRSPIGGNGTQYLYYSMPEDTHHRNQLKSYGGYITYRVTPGGDTRRPYTDIPDIVILGNNRTLTHRIRNVLARDRENDVSVRIFEGDWQVTDPSENRRDDYATRKDIMMVLANVEDILIRVQYIDGDGIDTTITNIDMDTADATNVGGAKAAFVEQCKCPGGYTGDSCEECASGYVRQPGAYLGVCSPIRDVECPRGYYGAPDRGIECRRCPCPVAGYYGSLTTCRLGSDNRPECDCREGYVGKRCELCDTQRGYTGDARVGDCRIHTVDECSEEGSLSPHRLSDGTCECKPYTTGPRCDQCVQDAFFLSSKNAYGCIQCFCMGTTKECSSSNLYRDSLETRFYSTSPQDFSLVKKNPDDDTFEKITPIVDPSTRELYYDNFDTAVYYWALSPSYLFDKVTSYGGHLHYTIRYTPSPGGMSSKNSAPDVEIRSANRITLTHYSKQSVEPEQEVNVTVPLLEQFWQGEFGRLTDREHLLQALADISGIYIKATYTTSTSRASLIWVSLDTATTRNTGRPKALEVEDCSCLEGYTGTSCEDCAPGFKRAEEGLYLKICEPCDCGGYSDDCDAETGVCRNCRDNRGGDRCERCREGYELTPDGRCAPTSGPGCSACDPRGTITCSSNRCICKTNVEGEYCNRCHRGTFSLSESNDLGCSECYCSEVSTDCQSSSLYMEQVAAFILDNDHGYTLSDGSSTVIRDGFKPNFGMSELGYRAGWRQDRLFWSLPSKLTGDKILSYGGVLSFSQRYTSNGNAEPTSDHDIIIAGNAKSIFYTFETPLEPGEKREATVNIIPGEWRVLDQRNGNPKASRQDILKVLSNVEHILVRASLAKNIDETYISDVFLETATQNPDGERAEQIEVCRCPPEYRGTSCQTCAEGHYKDNYDNTCKRSPCKHGQAMIEGRDYQVRCICDPGWQGNYCDEPMPDRDYSNVTISMEPAGRLYFVDGDSHLFRCAYNSTIPVRAEIREVHAYIASYGDTHDFVWRPRVVLWRSGDVERIVRITKHLSSVECVLIDEQEEVVGRAQAYIKVTRPSPSTNPPSPQIRMDIAVSPQGEIPEYSRVTLDCRAEAQSREPVSIKWSRQGGRLPRVIDDGRGRLTIVQAVSSDSGVYLCTAHTRSASDTKSIVITIDQQTDQPPYITVRPSTNIEALEGSEINVQCNAGGYPLPEIGWQRISGDFTDEVEFDGGTMKILRARKSDEGEYECTATNNAGQVREIVTIHVRSIVGQLSVYPREINSQQGQTITIRCNMEPPTDTITLRWIRNDRREFPRGAEELSGELTIRNIGPQDAGEYVCTAVDSTNGQKVSEASAFIRVRGVRPPPLRVEIHPSRQTVNERDTATLTCNTTIPDADVTWSILQRREVKGGRSELPRKAQVYGNVLRIPNVEWSDRAIYLCEGRAGGAVTRAQAFLEVRKRGVAPTVDLTERRLVMMEGDSAFSECRASGSPQPDVTWTKRGNPLLPRNIVQEGSLIRLNSLTLNDNGDYVCTANNSAGKTSATMRVEVQTRPKIHLEPRDTVKRTIGESLTLKCYASGVPAPAVRFEVNSPNGVRSVSEGTTTGTGQAQIDIFSLSVEDTGYYTCKATSAAGESEESIYVQVIDNDVNPDAPAHSTFEVDLGGATEIACSHPTTDPGVTYDWTRRDGRPLGRNVQVAGEHLNISNAQQSDAGDYVCEIKDRTGYSQTSIIATLKVIERLNIRLSPPSQVVHVNDNARILCEVIGNYPADITWDGVNRELPARAFVSGGQITFTRIQVEDQGSYRCTAVDPKTGYSVKALARVTVKQIRHPVSPTPRSRSDAYYRYYNMCDRTGNFLCNNGVLCINKLKVCNGLRDCNDGSDEQGCFQEHFDRGDNPPTVQIVGDKNISKTEGTSLLLQCVVSDSPNARVEWRRQGKNLPMNADARDNDLQIANLYPEDSGVYICTATSRQGLQGTDRVYVTVDQGCSAHGKIACSDGLTCYESSQMCDDRIDCPDASDEKMCNRRKRNPLSHGALAARVLIEPSVDRIRVGETVDLRCIAEGVFVSEFPTWEKVGGGIADNVLIRDNVLRIHDITTDNAGPYRCWVKKQNGQVIEDEYLLEVQVNYEPSPNTQRPHKNVKRLAEKTKTVRVYDSVDIECDTGLEPPVSFIWTRRNGQLLPNQTGIRIHLSNILPSDAGEYLCVASNSDVKIEFPTFLVVKGTIPRFTQQSSSYLKLKPMAGAAYLKFDLLLSIKPERPNGLILYNGEKKPPNKDFIAIGLRNGRVEFRFDVGSGEAIILSDNTVPMGKWSNITLKRERKEGRLWVNGIGPVIGASPGRYQGLDLNEPMYLGSVPNFTAISPAAGFDSGFVGCISFLKVNDQVEELSKALEKSDVTDCDTCSESRCKNNGVCQESTNEKGYQCLCPRGFSGEDCQHVGGTAACYQGLCNEGKCVNTHGSYKCQCRLGTSGDNCESKVMVTTPSFTGDSFLAYPIPHTTSDFSLNLEVQLADSGNALLAYAGQNTNGNGDFIALIVRDHHVWFTVDTGSGPETISNAYTLRPGQWATILVEKRADELTLDVNGEQSQKVLDARKTKVNKRGLSLHTPLYLGGYDETSISLHPSIYIKDGFQGCVKSLRINGRSSTHLIRNAIESSNIVQCSSVGHGANDVDDFNSPSRDDLCGEQQCQNGGRCDHSDGTPVCACSTNYGGAYCEIRTNECGLDPNPCGSQGICRSEKSVAEGYKCDCFFGYTGPTCQEKRSITTDVAFRRESYIELPGHLTHQLNPHDEVAISMTIQTDEMIGLLFWQGTDGHFMSIGVRDGFIEAEVDHNDNPLRIRSTDRVDDARPHNLTVIRKASDLEITLDGTTVASSNGQPPRRLPSRDSIFIGGLPDPWTQTNGRWKENFVGCITKLRINNGEALDFSKHRIDGRNVRSCLSSESNPLWLDNETK